MAANSANSTVRKVFCEIRDILKHSFTVVLIMRYHVLDYMINTFIHQDWDAHGCPAKG